MDVASNKRAGRSIGEKLKAIGNESLDGLDEELGKASKEQLDAAIKDKLAKSGQ